MAPGASKALRLTEATIAEGNNPHSLHSEESGTQRLARTAAELLTRRGSKVASIVDMWEIFLRGRGKKNYMKTYHGHRMNIWFYECMALTYHWDDLWEFLQSIPG